MFAANIAHTAKDIEVLIDSLPVEDPVTGGVECDEELLKMDEQRRRVSKSSGLDLHLLYKWSQILIYILLPTMFFNLFRYLRASTHFLKILHFRRHKS